MDEIFILCEKAEPVPPSARIGTRICAPIGPQAGSEKEQKHYGTPGSQVITRPSTGEAEPRLSSQF